MVSFSENFYYVGSLLKAEVIFGKGIMFQEMHSVSLLRRERNKTECTNKTNEGDFQSIQANLE